MNQTSDKIVNKLVNEMGGTILKEKEHTGQPIDDFVNGQRCCGCNRTFWNEDLKRIRIGIAEIDIKMNPDGKKDLIGELHDYVVCGQCYGRSYLNNNRIIRNNLQNMLGIDYRTPPEQQVKKPVKEKPNLWK